jgi:hypothetical protein
MVSETSLFGRSYESRNAWNREVSLTTLARLFDGFAIGLVVLTLARELWEQRMCDLDLAEVKDAPSTEPALKSAATSRSLFGDPMVLPSAHAGRQSDSNTLA